MHQEALAQASRAGTARRGRSGRGTLDGRAGHAATARPSSGAQQIEVPLDEVWPHLDLNTLFRLHWGVRKIDEVERQRLLETEFMPLLEELKAEAEREGWLRGHAVYGFFPAVADGNELVVWTRTIRSTRTSWSGCRSRARPGGEKLCLADYFQPIGGRPDLIAFQAVTTGRQTEAALRAAGDGRRVQPRPLHPWAGLFDGRGAGRSGQSARAGRPRDRRGSRAALQLGLQRLPGSRAAAARFWRFSAPTASGWN